MDDEDILIPGDRIRLIEMEQERPDRMYKGLEGTFHSHDGMGHLIMEWDNGSTLSLIVDVDKYERIE